ncbi:MAG: ABC transporter ATP-binding protein [Lachnospiraceae bacterium]|nr:ABC transporter ATP-binding protein/permease [Robinsoniella sp.]MDY3766772.1 ABC transporter ATP-binding protein [Lachnospiraceae bacterium]
MKKQKLSHYLVRYWYFYAIAIFCMAVQIVLDMLSPQVTKRIIDDVLGKGQSEIFPGLLLIIFVVGAGRCVAGYWKEFLFDCTGFRIGVDFRRNLFLHIQGLGADYFDRTNTGELMSRLKDDVDKISNAAGYVGMLMIEVTLHTCIVLTCMFRMSRRLFVIPLVAMPFIGIMAVLLERRLDKTYSDISEENAVLNTVAQENLSGVHTVKAFAREKFEIQKFLSHNKRYYELNMSQSKALVRYQPIFKMMTYLLPMGALVCGGIFVIDESMTLGTLGAFAEYCTNIVWPMEMLGWLLNEMAAAVASNKKVQKIYSQEPSIKEIKEPVPLPEIRGKVEFDHVVWKMGGKNILKDVSFVLPEGKTLGIMGETGSGKTSIIQLLQRFFNVTEGEIRLDGVPIQKLSLYTLRSAIAPVMQEVFLFSDTISSNVSLGCEGKIDDMTIQESLEKACAWEFVAHLEEEKETVIGERGVGLSGGQKQRISMARAFVRKAPILVLDDATSALDTETERQIQKNLSQMKGKTKIIIGHRISSVCGADEILVLEDGKVTERGTHKSLLEKKGYYYRTYQAQYGDALSDSGRKGDGERCRSI